MKLTPEQQRAVEVRNKNLLVSAAAGSGKTRVLVNRIIAMITQEEDPVDIDELLVVTFTNAAAGEMKERILIAIEEKLIRQPDNARLQRQQTLLQNANISTIHSFCLYVIRNYFHQIDLEPDFRIGDQGELKLLKRDVLEEVLEEYYEKKDPDFLELSEIIAPGKNDEKLKETILSLYEFSISDPWPRKWLRKCMTAYKVNNLEEFEKIPHGMALQQYLSSITRQWAKDLSYCISLASEEDGPTMYIETLEKEQQMMEKLEACITFQDYYQGLSQITFGRLPGARKFLGDPRKKQYVQDTRKAIKDAQKKLVEQFFFLPPQEMIENLQKNRKTIETLVQVTMRYMEVLEKRKLEENILDFSDLEHLALKILVKEETEEPTDTALALQKQFKEIMIDEYQDSNYVQEAILRAVSRGKNMFMVGDVKQSIYRFRMARPELFMEKYDTYGKVTQEGENEKIQLYQNFRSRSQVVNTVNDIFYQIMGRDLGNVEYDQEAALVAGKKFPDFILQNSQEEMEESTEVQQEFSEEIEESAEAQHGTQKKKELEKGTEAQQKTQEKIEENIEIQQETIEESTEFQDGTQKEKELEKGTEAQQKTSGNTEEKNRIFQTEILLADPQDFEESLDNSQLEASIIAEKIKILCESHQVSVVKKEEETGEEIETFRNISYGDIVILLRGISGRGTIMAETLKSYGIPAVVTTDTGYFSTIEVQTMLNFLRLVDNPRQDIPMAAVLQSAIGGITSEELAKIRIEFPQIPFYEGVFSYGKQGKEPILKEKISVFLGYLEKYRQRVCDTPVHELLYLMMEETGYLDYVHALPAGKVRRANLEMLYEKAIAYEKTSYHGLFHFVRYMEQLKKYQVDFGEAEVENGQEVVRIMTIHKSKGLEFPVVFVAGMGNGLNQQDSRQRMVLHAEYGIGLDIMNLEKRTRTPSLIRQILSRQVQMENMGEELRVLYVALTRAKEKLILTGTLKNAQEKLENYEFYYTDASTGGHMSFTERLKANCYWDWVLPVLISKNYPIVRITPAFFALQQIQTEIQQEWNLQKLLELSEHISKEDQKKIQERLSFCYPYKEEQDLKMKLSVSELKHRFFESMYETEEIPADFSEATEEVGSTEEVTPYVPDFMKEQHQENQGALRGTAMHRVMECLDFTRDLSQLEEQLKELKEQGRLEEEFYHRVSLVGIQKFFSTKLGQRMRNAAKNGSLYREKPFVMGKEDFYTQQGPMILIQGIIDVFFEEDDQWVLVDYKTDFVTTEQELLDRYTIQMELYQQALEQATGKKVKEKVIYSFRLNREIYL